MAYCKLRLGVDVIDCLINIMGSIVLRSTIHDEVLLINGGLETAIKLFAIDIFHLSLLCSSFAICLFGVFQLSLLKVLHCLLTGVSGLGF